MRSDLRRKMRARAEEDATRTRCAIVREVRTARNTACAVPFALKMRLSREFVLPCLMPRHAATRAA